MEDKITTIRLKESVKNRFKKFKKYPRETDEDTLIRLIKIELNKKEDDENVKDNKLANVENQEQDS